MQKNFTYRGGTLIINASEDGITKLGRYVLKLCNKTIKYIQGGSKNSL